MRLVAAILIHHADPISAERSSKVIVDAGFATEVVDESSIISRPFGDCVLKTRLEIPEICSIVRRSVLNEFFPALNIAQSCLADTLESVVFDFDCHNRTI